MTAELVERALAVLEGRYIFPERAREAAALVRRRADEDAYGKMDDEELGLRLTADFLEVCSDHHLRVRVREEGSEDALTEEQIQAVWHERMRRTNYGIARVERLDGNVGLLDLRNIADAAIGGRAFSAAMELVSETLGLIVDLRQNRGGAPDGVTYWLSHFFPAGETLLNSIYEGESGLTRQFWTLAWLPGRRYIDKPIWLLTSAATFSAGEEFAYDLQALGRATLVGETTRGGAHPCDTVPLTPTMEITIPVARSLNPVTGTNWEGTGVTPDIAVPAAGAFTVAYRAALEHVLGATESSAVLSEARSALDAL